MLNKSHKAQDTDRKPRLSSGAALCTTVSSLEANFHTLLLRALRIP